MTGSTHFEMTDNRKSENSDITDKENLHEIIRTLSMIGDANYYIELDAVKAVAAYYSVTEYFNEIQDKDDFDFSTRKYVSDSYYIISDTISKEDRTDEALDCLEKAIELIVDFDDWEAKNDVALYTYSKAWILMNELIFNDLLISFDNRDISNINTHIIIGIQVRNKCNPSLQGSTADIENTMIRLQSHFFKKSKLIVSQFFPVSAWAGQT